jgi:quercetin dioxygenase-like cupin family protein
MKIKFPSIATYLLLAIPLFSNASLAGGPHVNASEVNWRSTYTDYGPEFAKAFRFKTLVGGEYAPVQGKNVYFGEAEWAPGAIYVGHKHPSPEIYYVISGEAEWTVDGKTFRATPGTAIYAKPYAVHRMVNVGDGILKTVWMWWGTPSVTGQPSVRAEPLEKQPPGAVFPE